MEQDGAVVEAAASGGPVDDPQVAAVVALCDALMTRPADLPAETVAELRTRFTHEQLVEMALKVMKFNIQKTMVALGTDDAITAEVIDGLVWNADGMFVLAEPD